MEYSALEKKEVMPFVTTRMNQKDIMLSEKSPSQKEKYCLILLV